MEFYLPYLFCHGDLTFIFRYKITKLLQVLGVRELANALNQTKTEHPAVIINCVNPGACKSDFDRESTGIERLIKHLLTFLIARSTEAGSRTLVAGIAAGEESNGAYMADCVVTE